MPLMDYNNFGGTWTKFGEVNHKRIFETLLDAPVGRSRGDFIRLLDADTHFGKASFRFLPGRGNVGAGGVHPSQLIRNNVTATRMGFAIGVNLLAGFFAKITMEESIKLTSLNEEQAWAETSLMLIALVRTCEKLQTKTSPSGVKVLPQYGNKSKATRIYGYSRA